MADIVTADIFALAHGGDCVGTTLDGTYKDKKIFLPNTIPGETVKAEITKQEKNLSRGKLLDILKPSSSRISPACPIFGTCGGCDYQHIEISAQRRFKEEMVLSMLQKQAGIKPLEFISRHEELPAYNYRSRVTLHLNPNGELGFYRKGSGDVVDCNYCHISTEPINTALNKVRKFKDQLKNFVAGIVIEDYEGSIYVVLNLRDDGSPGFDENLSSTLKNEISNIKIVKNGETVTSNIADGYPAGHFSQVNEAGNEILIETVKQNIQGDTVLDLYSGDGNFSIPLALTGKDVVCVEIDEELVRFAEVKAAMYNVQNKIRQQLLSCERYFKKQPPLPSVLLDPPRSGAKNILHAFQNGVVSEVVYVSCSLPSFCRDAKEILKCGFSLKKLYMIDMFPQTHHVETVSVFTR